MILLDTHTLIWWANKDKTSLPETLLDLINQNQKNGTLCVSSISFWEIALLHKKEKIDLRSDFNTWVKVVLSIPSFKSLAPDTDILIRSVFLESFPHKDPADRIIVATALSLGATIITKDDKILSYKHVRSLWE